MKSRHYLFKIFSGIIFVTYALVLVYILFLMRSPMSAPKYNLIPFMTIVEYTDEIVDPGKYSLMSLINLIGNGLLFVPFGFFLPLLCRHLRKWRRVLALTSVIVLVIEVTQYFTLLGVADIDDFILNVAGSMLGYILYAGIREDILSEHTR